MKQLIKKIKGLVLPIALLLISVQVPAQEQSQSDQVLEVKEDAAIAVPDLAGIIPLATELSGRLATLENKITGVLDVSAVQDGYTEVESSLKDLTAKVHRLKETREYRSRNLVDLREAIGKENKLFEQTGKPLNQSIRQLGAWRTEWLAEEQRWNKWQSAVLEDADFDQLKSTFAKATATIETALNLLLPQLETLLSLQEKAANTQAKIDALTIELDNLIVGDQRDALLYASPPMLSSVYFDQFSSELSYTIREGLDEISWSGGRFFARHGGIFFFQGFLTLIVIITVFRNRRALNESKRWRFLAARPFSAGIFLGAITTMWLYYFGGASAIWKLLINTVAGLSFARLSGALVEASWRRKFVYVLMFALIITELLNVLDFPLPLFRLYTVLAALTLLLLCTRWAGESIRQKDSGFYTWSLRLGALIFAALIIAELWGKAALAQDHVAIAITVRCSSKIQPVITLCPGDQLGRVDKIRIRMTATEVLERLAIHDGAGGRAQYLFEESFRVGPRDCMHCIESHVEVRAGNQAANRIEIEQRGHQLCIIVNRIDDGDLHLVDLVIAGIIQINIICLGNTILADLLAEIENGFRNLFGRGSAIVDIELDAEVATGAAWIVARREDDPALRPVFSDEMRHSRGRKDSALTDDDTTHPVDRGHFQDDLDRIAIVKAPVTTEDEGSAAKFRVGLEDRLDEILQIVRTAEECDFFPEPGCARTLVVKRCGPDCFHDNTW